MENFSKNMQFWHHNCQETLETILLLHMPCSAVTNLAKSGGEKGNLYIPSGEHVLCPQQAHFKTNLLNSMEIFFFSPFSWNSRHWLRINYKTGCFYLGRKFLHLSGMLSFLGRNTGLSSLQAFIKESHRKKYFLKKFPTAYLFYIVTCCWKSLILFHFLINTCLNLQRIDTEFWTTLQAEKKING